MGALTIDPKLEADSVAIGVLRDAASTLRRLRSSTKFGKSLRLAIRKAVTENLIECSSKRQVEAGGVHDVQQNW